MKKVHPTAKHTDGKKIPDGKRKNLDQMKWLRGKTLSDGNLKKVEDEWNVILPSSFKQVVMSSNNGYPEKKAFKSHTGHERIFSGLLNFDLTEKYNVLSRYRLVADVLPEKTFPFAADAAGNLICFSYQKSNDEPEILFWNHEGIVVGNVETYEVEYVAESFDHLLSILYPPQPLDDDIDVSKFPVRF